RTVRSPAPSATRRPRARTPRTCCFPRSPCAGSVIGRAEGRGPAAWSATSTTTRRRSAIQAARSPCRSSPRARGRPEALPGRRRVPAMRYGFYLPTRGRSAEPDALEALVERAVSDEYLRIFKTLWTQSAASFSGEFYRFESIKCLPQPVKKPHPPIWVGGHSRAALRRAARHGDGWHPVGANPAATLAPPEF